RNFCVCSGFGPVRCHLLFVPFSGSTGWGTNFWVACGPYLAVHDRPAAVAWPGRASGPVADARSRQLALWGDAAALCKSAWPSIVAVHVGTAAWQSPACI